MAKTPRYDKETVKARANGQWHILLAKLGFDPEILDGRAHPCPKCGGTDRFRFTNLNGNGSIYCNKCGKGIGDGFAAEEWRSGEEFKTTLAKVAEWVGEAPLVNGHSTKYRSQNGEAVDPAARLEFLPWNDGLANLWCLWKSPVTAPSLLAVGARRAKYYFGRYNVLAIPIWGEKLAATDPVGWCLYNITGGTLPRDTREPDGEQVKIKLTYGSKPGWIGPIDKLAAAKHVWKLEGVSDLLAFYSLPNIPPETIALTNACGAKERPQEWMLKLLKGKVVSVLHDADSPGQEGLLGYEQGGKHVHGWLDLISQYAVETWHVTLPYEVDGDSGSDLRDYLNGARA